MFIVVTEPDVHRLTGDFPRLGEFNRVVNLEHHDPFSILGNHQLRKDLWRIHAYAPDAGNVTVLPEDDSLPDRSMNLLDERGLFAAEYRGRNEPFVYRLRVETESGENWT